MKDVDKRCGKHGSVLTVERGPAYFGPIEFEGYDGYEVFWTFLCDGQRLDDVMEPHELLGSNPEAGNTFAGHMTVSHSTSVVIEESV